MALVVSLFAVLIIVPLTYVVSVLCGIIVGAKDGALEEHEEVVDTLRLWPWRRMADSIIGRDIETLSEQESKSS